MGNHVGIVYGDQDSPLYCYSDGKYWHVINGGWSFTKDSETIPHGTHPRPKWKIILRDMKGNMDYNEACWQIMEEAKKLNERKDIRVRGFGSKTNWARSDKNTTGKGQTSNR